MMRYAYTHTGTEATTGYFTCAPPSSLSIEEALRYLAAHPLDDFMRRHALSCMGSLSRLEAMETIRRAFAGFSSCTEGEAPPLPPPIRALILELSLLIPHFAGLADEEPGPADLDATSLIFLRWEKLPDRSAQQAWGRYFASNIQRHHALKSPEATGLAPLYPPKPELLPGLPGLGPAFTDPFSVSLAELFPEHLSRVNPQKAPYTRPPAEETAALAEARLHAAGIIAGGQMRHTASLSPIALLRPWRLMLRVNAGRHAFTLEGQATTYGRGLSLADARASCLMEMVERASAYLSIGPEAVEGKSVPCPLISGPRSHIVREFGPALDPNDYPLETPYRDAPLNWLQGSLPDGSGLYVPAQMAGLFCNLDEIALYDAPGSTGIATGCSIEEAKVAALLEIFERDAEATTPFSKASCFALRADPDTDPLIAALLADYAALGIQVQFQDLTGPLGVPVFQCFVMSARGGIARGHGAGLCARRAVLSALTETPFPYPDGGPSGPLLRNLPVRQLHELPDYSLPSPKANLALLEDLLMRNKRPPAYVDLTRPDLEFPVVRALVPGMELAADSDAFSRVPWRLYANYLRLTATT